MEKLDQKHFTIYKIVVITFLILFFGVLSAVSAPIETDSTKTKSDTTKIVKPSIIPEGEYPN